MSFSIESKRYSSLEEDYRKASDIIKRAINAGRPIIIRHHNDCDGISAGLMLEEVCTQLMNQALVKPQYNLFRSSCRAPFYDFADFLKDLNTIKRGKSRGGKNPLVLITDNGSTSEDYLALKSLKSVGVEVIVIDHHAPVVISEGVSKNCEFLVAHINPHLRGFGSELCAGMLCFELANYLIPNSRFVIPAVAGVDDRVVCDEIDFYIEKSGKTRSELAQIASALDFIVFNSKFDLDSGVLEEVFFNPDLVDVIIEEISKLEKTKFASVKQSIVKKDLGKLNLVIVDMENYSERFVYPRTGKLTEMILDESSNSFICSVVGESITIRESEEYISIHNLIIELQKSLPFANVKGGGHAVAGTISFVKAYKTDVLEKIEEILSNL